MKMMLMMMSEIKKQELSQLISNQWN